MRLLKSNIETKNALWLIGGKVSQMLLSLIVGILSARYLGPSNYGIIGYATAMISFFMSFCTLGINSVIVKELLDNPSQQGEALGSSIFLRSISSFLSCIFIFCISLFLDYGDWETILVVSLCSISLLFHVFDTINYWFQSQHKSNISAIAIFIAYFVTSVYKVILLMLKKSIFWFACATSVDYIVLSIILLVCYKMHAGPRLSISLNKGFAILKKSYHYILSGMMVAIYSQTDKLMLKHMLNEQSVGYYTTALSICSVWTFILSAIIDAMYPSIIKSFKLSTEDFNKKNRQLYALIFYISLFVSSMLVIFGELAINILYGDTYLPSAAPLKIITWYTAFSYFGVARNAWMVCNDKQRYLKYMYIFAALLNIVLNSILIPSLGCSGAAIASLITQLFTSIVLPYCIKDLRPNAKLILEAIMLKNVF